MSANGNAIQTISSPSPAKKIMDKTASPRDTTADLTINPMEREKILSSIICNDLIGLHPRQSLMTTSLFQGETRDKRDLLIEKKYMMKIRKFFQMSKYSPIPRE